MPRKISMKNVMSRGTNLSQYVNEPSPSEAKFLPRRDAHQFQREAQKEKSNTGGENKRPKSPLRISPRNHTVAEEGLTVSILSLKELVLDLSGNFSNLSQRLEAMEVKKIKINTTPEPEDNNKFTQTESDCSMYPPACPEAAELWEKYTISKKTDTQILIEALKNLDLKSVIENQNSQIRHQTNILNNLNRNFAQHSKSGPEKKVDAQKPQNKTRNSRIQNSSTSTKRTKKNEWVRGGVHAGASRWYYDKWYDKLQALEFTGKSSNSKLHLFYNKSSVIYE